MGFIASEGQSGKRTDDRSSEWGSQQLDQWRICARYCSCLHVGLPRLHRFPVGNLDEGVGIIEHLVPRTTKKAVLALSLRRDEALEETLELVPPAGFGFQCDNHFDSHLPLPVVVAQGPISLYLAQNTLNMLDLCRLHSAICLLSANALKESAMPNCSELHEPGGGSKEAIEPDWSAYPHGDL